jgi:hypothetical protein
MKNGKLRRKNTKEEEKGLNMSIKGSSNKVKDR